MQRYPFADKGGDVCLFDLRGLFRLAARHDFDKPVFDEFRRAAVREQEARAHRLAARDAVAREHFGEQPARIARLAVGKYF